MHIELRDQGFDPWAEIAVFRDRMLSAGQYGACAVFVGTMRDYNEGDRVRSMYLEHYPVDQSYNSFLFRIILF